MTVSSPALPAFLVAAAVLAFPGTAAAQAPTPGEEKVQEVIVTGSRIAQSEAQREQPLSVISNEAIEKTGLAGVGELLQQLTTGGSALNAKFNSSTVHSQVLPLSPTGGIPLLFTLPTISA